MSRGSTRLLERDAAVVDRALIRCHELLAAPADAVHAAIAAQRALRAEDWAAIGLEGTLRICIALHRGAVARRGRHHAVMEVATWPEMGQPGR